MTIATGPREQIQHSAMFDQRMVYLREKCIEKHQKDDKALYRYMILVASLVAGITIKFFVNGFMGFPLGLIAFFLASSCGAKIYHNLKDSSLLYASEALREMEFREFLSQRFPNVTENDIVPAFNQYKQYIINRVIPLP